MISLAEAIIVLAVATLLVGFAVFKSRRVRIGIAILMAITLVRALIGVALRRG